MNMTPRTQLVFVANGQISREPIQVFPLWTLRRGRGSARALTLVSRVSHHGDLQNPYLGCDARIFCAKQLYETPRPRNPCRARVFVYAIYMYISIKVSSCKVIRARRRRHTSSQPPTYIYIYSAADVFGRTRSNGTLIPVFVY